MSPDLLRVRLRNQRLVGPRCRTPAEVVGWFGAVQAQDYAAAKWALALRTRRATERDVEAAFDRRDIIRTHVLRPTWHFVLPEDLRWMLALTAPRVKQAMAFHGRWLGIDDKAISRAKARLENALAGGRQLTRAELARLLHATGPKLAHLVMFAELDAVVCSGPRRGKQFTYALVDERCPPATPLDGDEALGRLAERYFRSHGPALPRDFAWWSGLTAAGARRAIDIAGLTARDGRWSKSWTPSRAGPVAHFLPNFDEFLVAYKVRERRELSSALIVDGRLVESVRGLTAPERRAVAEAHARYSAYRK
ncbi:MAG: winged helix DNA-binding domain-containing protein [Myxococcales bacterium]